jgi:hypothetical protein
LILARRRLRAREEKDQKPLDSQQSIFAVLRRFAFGSGASGGSEFVKKSRVLWKTWIAFTIGL